MFQPKHVIPPRLPEFQCNEKLDLVPDVLQAFFHNEESHTCVCDENGLRMRGFSLEIQRVIR